MKIQATRHHPDIEITFSAESGDLVARQGKDMGGVLHKEVISVSTNNDLQSDAGTFQIVLANRRYWERYLASNDLVTIKMYRDKDKENPETPVVMIGLIDDVRRSVAINDNTVQRNITITGRSFAKVLMNFEVGAVQETDINLTDIGWLQGRITFVGMSSAEIIEQLFEEVVFKYMDYEFRDAGSIKDMIKLDLSSRPDEFLSDETSFINYQGSMQSFVREALNEPFNQIFWEYYKDGKATLVMRETPFNKNNWDKLYTHILHDEDVINDSTGRSDVEVYTLFSVGSQNFFAAMDVNKTLGVFPLWHEEHFKKYGIRRLHRLTSYADVLAEEDAEDNTEETGDGGETADNKEEGGEADDEKKGDTEKKEGTGGVIGGGIGNIINESHKTGTSVKGVTERFLNKSGKDLKSDEASGTNLEKYREDLFNWNIMNGSFYNGFLMIKGNSKYKIGDRLLYKSKESKKEIEFYIESVAHEYTQFGSWITKLGVTRGMLNNGMKRFDPPWGEGVEYDGTALGGPSTAEIIEQQNEAIDKVGSAIRGTLGGGGTGNGSAPGSAGSFPGVGEPQALDLNLVTYKYAPNGSAQYASLGLGTSAHYGTDFDYRYQEIKTPIGGKLTTRFISGGGNTVFIQNGSTHIMFMHMSTMVPEGQVSAGDVIGKSGNTGSMTTGPHLHFQVQEGTDAINHGTVDPEVWLKNLKKGGGAATETDSSIGNAIEEYGRSFIGKVNYSYGAGYKQAERDNMMYDNASWAIEVLNRTGVADIDEPVKAFHLATNGEGVTIHDAIKGDLIFFNTTQRNGVVGIWLGDDKFLVCSKKGVTVEHLSDEQWAQRFDGVVRRFIGKGVGLDE